MNLLQNNELTMSSVNLHGLINIYRDQSGLKAVRYGDFLARVEDEIDDLGDCESFAHPQNKQNLRKYQLNKDQCLLVGMRESKSVRKKVLTYVNSLENQQPKGPALPGNYIEALESLIASEKEKAVLAEQIEQQKPAVSFVADYVEASTGSKTFREVAKLLKENERELRAFLSDNKIMYQKAGTWYAYAQHESAGRFEVKTGVNRRGHSYNQTLFTAKGFAWLAGEIGRSKALQLV